MTAPLSSVRLAAITLLLLAGLAPAQDGTSRSSPLPGGNAVDPEVLRRLAAQLGPADGAGFDGDLMKMIQELAKTGPPNDGMKKRIEDQLKNLSPEQQLKMLNQLGGKLPPGFEMPKPQDIPRPQFPKWPPADPRPGEPPPIGPRPPFVPDGGPQQIPIPQPDINAKFPPLRFQPNTPGAREAIEFWEKNIGSLNEMPALRDALVELAASGADSANGGKPFWQDLLNEVGTGGSGGSSGGFMRWLNRNTGDWSFSTGGSGWSPPASGWGGGSSGGGFSAPSGQGLGAVGIVLLSVIGAVLVGLFVWKVLPVLRDGRSPRPLPGHGPWPLDPRGIRTREQLVAAFEYLSVLECGDGARTWNHVTIAAALRAAVPAAAGIADPLAKAYAFARYTPEAEPISDAAIAEARGYLCQLAGVAAA